MRKIIRILSSRRLAIILLGLTIFLSIVGTTFQDEGEIGSYARSWWFVLVSVLLLISTVVCTIQRVKGINYAKELQYHNIFNSERKIITNKDIFEGYSALDAELMKHRYKIQFKKKASESFLVQGIKGQLGFWGSIIFHTSFILIGIGVILSAGFKFSGEFILVEGERFSDYLDGYQNRKTGIFYRDNHGKYELEFKEFKPIISKNKRVKLASEYAEDYVSKVAIIDNYGTVKEVELGVNQQVKYKGYNINPDYFGHGFAPKLKVTKVNEKMAKEQGEELLIDSFIPLNTNLYGSYDKLADVTSTVTYRDEIVLSNFNWQLKVNFFPNKPAKGEKVVKSSAFAKDPMISVEIINLEDKAILYQGVVQLKESIRIDSYNLEFTEVENWQRFLVRKDRGQEIVYIGFFVGIIGLVLRFTQHKRIILGLIKVEEGKTVIYLKEILENKSLQKPQLDKIIGSVKGD